ncbi:MAG: FAD-dependent oxidoreductase [Chloroflexota bacterium]|nr:FAD-dependent oxidoreductase [Chloroflexota bacterium]
MAEKYDVIIIGAGIVGSMVARYLSRYHLNIMSIDKEVDVGIDIIASRDMPEM